MAEDEGKRTSRPQPDADPVIDWIWGDGTTNRINQAVNDWGREQIQSAREAIAAATADAEESNEVIVIPVEVAASGGGSGESEPESNVEGEGEEEGRRTTISPEVVNIPGGQIRVYKDSDGTFLRAVRDEIDSKPGETSVNHDVEEYADEAAVWAARREYAGLPAATASPGTAGEGGDRAADDEEAPGRSRTTWERIQDYREDGTPMTKPVDMNTKNIRPGIDDMVGALNDEAAAYGADPFKSDPIKDPFGRGQLHQLDLDAAGTGNNPPSTENGHTPGSSGNPPPDPMDPNPTSAINRNDLDVFNRYTGASGGGTGTGSGSGSGSGSSGSGDTGLGGTGLSGGVFVAFRPGTTGAGTGSTDGGEGAGTTGGAGTGSTDSGEGSGTTASANGSATTSEDDDGVVVEDVEDDDADAPPTGTVTVDYDGVVVEDVEEDDSGSGDEAGVSTSVDPMGGNTRASAADIQRAAEWAAWQHGNKSPIDPADDRGYSEPRGGTVKGRDAATELGQPPDDAAPRPDVPTSIAPRGQGETIMPTDDTLSDPQMGPEDGSINPFGQPQLGGSFGSNGSSSSADEEKDSMPVQGTYVAEVNIIGQPKESLPPVMYAAHDPSNHQYQQSQLEQDQATEEDAATKKMAWLQEEDIYKDLTPISIGGDMPSRHESDDEEDEASLD